MKADILASSNLSPSPAPESVRPGEAGELHQVVIRIWEETLIQYLIGKRKIVNIPDGATIISAWFDHNFYSQPVERNYLYLRIEHPSLPAHVPGSRLRLIGAKYRPLRVDPTEPILAAVLKEAKAK